MCTLCCTLTFYEHTIYRRFFNMSITQGDVVMTINLGHIVQLGYEYIYYVLELCCLAQTGFSCIHVIFSHCVSLIFN